MQNEFGDIQLQSLRIYYYFCCEFLKVFMQFFAFIFVEAETKLHDFDLSFFQQLKEGFPA